ncbi:hypothetical protein PTSG_03863 [Salpingoeca rosetta]|uniref:Uncharacterized protein n=1 Tax=Salpingoeca rosetta (strain ATCC 50818 / BSB-021) TaxID=946362 RepID=F2U5L5_SALR5|nr:uncharacterized protein PTSG_03863 [Salpingoeca rosetta]EGD83231.1 hypothetical protein PTSG_03863 [Salpingoeca rosetta]|eukprot:XP_004995595.1 hypothetical protein PTSG_03863 [Salpingoeca rosetta]
MGCGQSKDEDLRDENIRSRAPTSRAAASQPVTPATHHQQRPDRIAAVIDRSEERARQEEDLQQQLEDAMMNTHRGYESDDEDEDDVMDRRARVLEATVQQPPSVPRSTITDAAAVMAEPLRLMPDVPEDVLGQMQEVQSNALTSAGVKPRAETINMSTRLV